jgi:hypothetical protein
MVGSVSKSCSPISLIGTRILTFNPFAAWKCQRTFSLNAPGVFGNLSAATIALGTLACLSIAAEPNAMTTPLALSWRAWRVKHLKRLNTTVFRSCALPWVSNTPSHMWLAMNTLHPVAKKIQGRASNGMCSKKMWLGRHSTFPNFEKIFIIFKNIFLLFLMTLF